MASIRPSPKVKMGQNDSLCRAESHLRKPPRSRHECYALAWVKWGTKSKRLRYKVPDSPLTIKKDSGMQTHVALRSHPTLKLLLPDPWCWAPVERSVGLTDLPFCRRTLKTTA